MAAKPVDLGPPKDVKTPTGVKTGNLDLSKDQLADLMTEMLKDINAPATPTDRDDPARAATHLDLAKADALLSARLAPLQAELGVDLATISHHA